MTGGGSPRAEQLEPLGYLDAASARACGVRTILPFVVRMTKAAVHGGRPRIPARRALMPVQPSRAPPGGPVSGAAKFRPERFLERRYAAHEWFPFGGGNRVCLGMAFALYEMKVVLATLFTQIRLERPPGSRSSPIRQGISLGPGDGAQMVVTGRIE